MSKSNLNSCKTHSQIVRAVKSNGCEVRHGANHDKIYYNGQFVTAVPRHAGDLARGTLHAILKALAGIGIIGIAWFVLAHFGG